MSQVLRAILLSPRRSFAPIVTSLFSNGEPGTFVIADYTKALFQDAAMSIPAAIGMPVVKALDLSGRGNHVTFANVTLQQNAAGKKYFSFNGSTSSGATSAINMTGTDKVFVCAGYSASAGVSCVLEFSASTPANTGAFALFTGADAAGNVVANSHQFSLKGDSLYRLSKTVAGAVVSTLVGDISLADGTTELVPSINGSSADFTVNGTTAGTGNLGNHPLYIGMRGGATSPLTGEVYGFIVRGATPTAGQIADTRAYMARLTGVNL